MEISYIFQPFFIDHHSRGTSFIDPRLPTDIPLWNPDFVHTSLLRVRHRSGGQEHSPTRSEAVCSYISGLVETMLNLTFNVVSYQNQKQTFTKGKNCTCVDWFSEKLVI